MPDNGTNVPSFHGDFVRGIDDSWRVMMPAEWKPEDPKTVFTALAWPIQTKNCLLVLPPERWRVMLEKLRAKSLNNEQVAVFERVIGANSVSFTLDKVGRFRLPEDLANKIGLKKLTRMIGRLDKFEIWSPDRYQPVEAAKTANEALAAEVAAGLDL
jgi:MraZ protein